MTSLKNLANLSATQAAKALAQREIKAEDLLNDCLNQIGIREPEVHAWVSFAKIHAQTQARELDRGPIQGILHGLPIGVKDLFDTHDLPTNYGSPIYGNNHPICDAVSVSLMREAGAIILGKTVTTEFASFTPGPTRNPRNLDHTPGGSSSGSAAAVADYMVPLATGSQTAASILRPASYCGVVGYKPSYGKISIGGVKSLSVTLDTLGVFGRTVSDVALGVAAMSADHDLMNITPLESKIRIGICKTDDFAHAQAETAAALSLAGFAAKAFANGREVGFTILSISLSLVAVFIPIFFMEGPIGLLFREFAVVVSLAIVVSAVVSLTLVPMLCSRYLPKPGQHAREFAINRHFDRWFEWTQKTYVHYLDIALQKRKQVLWLAVATFVITIAMFVYTPKGFFPEEDIGQITATTEADQDISFKAMLELQDRAAQIVANDPNVANFVSILGGGLSAGSNTGRFFIVLKPRDERESMTKVLEGLRAKFRDVPGLQVFMRPIQNLQLGGRSSKSRYQFTLQSVGFEGVNEWSEKLLEKLRVDPIFRDVTSDSQMKGLNVQIDINRDKAAQAGVTIADIRQALYNAFGQRQVSTIYTSVNTYYVILETAEDQRQFETDLNKVFLRGRATNQLIPLSSLASFKRTIGPTAVNHQGQIPAVTLSFNLAPDVALGEATDKIEKYVKEVNLPPSIITSYGGDAKVFKGNQT
ncbi:MAG: hypothetical protein EBX46_05040, partial [Burkholderiaceae bacterium]|nr:hypothetical protein [Burkholderiaceae bacterium]